MRFWFFIVSVLLTLLAGQAVQAQVHPHAAPANAIVPESPDSAVLKQEEFNVMFMAEPGDTLVLSHPSDTLAFVEKDTIDVITEADVFDTLDFRSFVPGTPYELIADRISCLAGTCTMPLTYNRTVNSFINFFTVRKRNYTQTIIERRNHYFPLFEEMLKKYGLPDELKYLSIVESALNTRALSRSGAVGLWQFMGGTARDLKLYQDTYIDERMDPRKATEAACKYLKYLYGTFNDWELSLAAYNCGPGAIRRTMQRTGGKTFWEIYPALPAETRSYVPQFTAVVYTMNYAAEHNLYPDVDSILTAGETDTVLLDRQLNLAALAHHLEVDPKHLAFLNPTLRKPVSPEQVPFTLTLPADAAERFREERAFFLDSCLGEPLAADVPQATARKGRHAEISTDRNSVKRHIVRRGETLYAIADKYGVSVHDIKKLNHLRSLRLRAGQRLVLHKGKNKEHAPAEATASAHKPSQEPAGEKTYEVQPGDTLWNISQRYKSSVQDLIRVNNLKDKNLKVGMKLIVSVG